MSSAESGEGRGGLVETVSGLLVNGKGEVLLGLRASWKRVAPNLWDAVGGHLEPGESLEAGLIREVREEVGVIATQFRHLAAIREPRPDLYPDALHHLYSITAWEGEPANVCDEHDEIRWFSAREVGALTNITGFDWPTLVALATSPPR